MDSLERIDAVRIAAAVVGLLLAGNPANYAATTVDNFSAGGFNLAVSAPEASDNDFDYQASLDPAAVIGGQRSAVLEHESGPGFITADVVTTDGGTLIYSAPHNAVGHGLRLAYGSTIAVSAPAMNLDIASDGANALAIDVEFASDEIPLTLSYATQQPFTVRGSFVYTTLPASMVPYTVHYPFSALHDVGLGVDFSGVDGIGVTFGFGFGTVPIPAGAQFRINSMRFVTEPQPPGDFNHDDAVNAADYVVWRKNPGGTYTHNDFNEWRAHFGAALGGGSGSISAFPPPPSTFPTAVPEPASVNLVALVPLGIILLTARSGCRPFMNRTLIVTALALLATACPTSAALFNASNVAELIAAIDAANQNAEPDFITLSAGTTFTLTAIHNATNGSNGLPTIADHNKLTIVGNGALIERSSADGTPAFRLLNVALGASLALDNVTLQGGLTRGDGVQYGGAIYNAGSLSLVGVTVQYNIAQGRNGSLGIQGSGGPGFPGWGGGIYSSGSLILENSTVQNNQALGGVGGFSSCSGSSCQNYHGGRGGDGLGGAIYAADGIAILRDSRLTGNLAQGGIGGSGPNRGSPGIGSGGGINIDDTEVGLDQSTFSNITGNMASTSDPDIAGPYEIIPISLEGDYNNSGTVDAADYVVWRKTDDSPDGYDAWRAHFGQTLSVGGGTALPSAALPTPTVPEPSEAALFAVAIALTLVAPWARRRALNTRTRHGDRAMLAMLPALSAFFAGESAHAQYLTYHFTGVVRESFSSAVDVGDPLQGTFTYSLHEPDDHNDPNIGRYSYWSLFDGPSPIGLSFTAGSYMGSSAVRSQWEVRNDQQSLGSLLYPSCNGQCDAFRLDNIWNLYQSNTFTLVDRSGTAFDSDASPALLDLGAFSVGEFEAWAEGHTFVARIDTLALIATQPPPPPPGDFNHDGSVDAADFVAWNKNGGTEDEYNTWKANFGRPSGTASSSIASVPEPATAMILLIGAAAELVGRRNRMK